MTIQHAGHRETTCYAERKREQTQFLNFFSSFCCRSNVIAYLFLLHSCTCSVRRLFGAHPKMEAATFDYLHIVLYCVHSHFYLVTSPNQLTFKPESSPCFCLVSERGYIRFQWFHTCTKRGGTYFFLVMFNYHSRSPVTGWPATSALVWLLRGLLADP